MASRHAGGFPPPLRVRPLPRLLAYLDDRVAGRDDLGVGLAAIAAAGPAVALVARLPGGTTDALAALAARCVANATPPEAQVLVAGRVDVALATGADGVVARRDDLPIAELRALARQRGGCTILASVHSRDEAAAALTAGADGLVVGTIWASASHPGRPGAGVGLLRECAALGAPVWAIGGVTAARVSEARDAGAWGVAAISALWDPSDHFKATMAMLDGVVGH